MHMHKYAQNDQGLLLCTFFIFLILLLVYFSNKMINLISFQVYKPENLYQFEYKKKKEMSCLQKTYNLLCCVSQPKYPTPYAFNYNGFDKTAENQLSFESNFVRTSKYTLWSFFPKALLLQFKRLANIYFLVIAILQTIPSISPLNPVVAWIPLVIVLAISMLRQGYQDFQRMKSDKQTNYQTITHVRRSGKFEESNWSQIVIGDIVKVHQQQLFPADLLLIASANQGGIAYIQTASLDGQKNLKPRSAYNQTQKYQIESALDNLQGRFQGDQPNKQLHQFSGSLNVKDNQISLSGDKQLLYRGTRLKNTKWIYGLTIYTGKNTKIIMNSDLSSEKMSQIQIKVNRILVFILLVQVACSIGIAIFYGVFTNQNFDNFRYILWRINAASGGQIVGDSILIFFTMFVLINTMIPISLVVSIEIVKFSQSIFINNDKLMYSQFRKKNSQVKSASLNQQLGQIQYVFSDKTGTLTMNLMEFKIAVIGKKMYGDLALISEEANARPSQEQGFHSDQLKLLILNPSSASASPEITISDKSGIHKQTFKTQRQLAQEYLKALALAHQVVVQKDEKTGRKFYQGPSPDQITLVDAAKSMDVEFLRATQQSTTIRIRGDQKTYQLLDLFAFTSDRKRMSVIVRDQKGVIKMYTKGADSIVKERLARGQIFDLDSQLNRFARIGLRTLLIAMKILSQEQYNQYRKELAGLPKTKSQEAKEALISNLQRDLHLIGATAVLDRLQEDVPETIRDLIRANIKVWMLTGDKMQTAENIAKSCNLIQNHFKILRFQPRDSDNKLALLKKVVNDAQIYSEAAQQKAFLIEGSNLSFIIGNPEAETQLANLAVQCEAVVCCRLLPIQKAEVVRIVRQKLNKITLSIGDGANDVPMIKTAHIGVGLFGEEGMGAVQASDYALPQFRMLWRLLLVHGRWNYIRISEMILYFFYKNMFFTIPQLVFAFYNGYSGQTAYDDYYIALYNLLFTSSPLIVRAVLEQDVNYFYRAKTQQMQLKSSALLLRNPSLQRQNRYLPKGYKINKYFYRLFPKIYFIGQENCIFNYQNYLAWAVEGVVEGIVATIFTIYIIGQLSLNSTGVNSDWWIVGLIVYSIVVIIVTVKLATHTKSWSVALFVITGLSLLIYVAYMWISNYALSDHIQGTVLTSFQTGETYLLVLLCICIIIAIDGFVVFLDFDRGGYASKMRRIVEKQKQLNRQQYDEFSVKITDNLSVKPS